MDETVLSAENIWETDRLHSFSVILFQLSRPWLSELFDHSFSQCTFKTNYEISRSCNKQALQSSEYYRQESGFLKYLQ